MLSIQQITFNFAPAPGVSLRHDRMEGREYIVAPMVMLTEGVHAGSNGPLYYPADELSKTPAVWNMKPIVVYHPTFNGQGISACDPLIVDTQKVGLIMNTVWDGKLRAEAWLEIDKTKTVDRRVLTALEAGEVMEVSTGVFTDNEETEGEWNGTPYVAIARNLRADHLAVLPDKVGACSVADGAGLLQLNELSHSNLFSGLAAAIRTTKGDSAWMLDVYSNFFIYEIGEKVYRDGYTVSNTEVTIAGKPEEVVRVTEYRTAEGAFVGNATAKYKPLHEDNTMEKEKLVDSIIANEATKWEAGDREFLMGLEPPQLEKMDVKPPPVEPVDNAVADAAKKGGADAGPQPPVVPADPVVNKEKPVTVQGYVENAPPEIREVLEGGLAAVATERAALTQMITANKANTFTAESLGAKTLDDLRGLAALARGPEEKMPVANYAGAAAGTPLTENVVEPLPLPVMSFGEEDK